MHLEVSIPNVFPVYDVGGTWIRRSLCRANSIVSPEVILNTPTVLCSPEDLAESLIAPLASLKDFDPVLVKGICISIAGPISAKGTVFSSSLKYEDVNLARIVQKAFFIRFGIKVPVFVINDADAAALAEYVYGAGQGAKAVLYLTVSTGIGAGFVRDGVVYTGPGGQTVLEIGHMNVSAYGVRPVCACGGRGHLEAFASGPAIARDANDPSKPLVALQRYRESRGLTYLTCKDVGEAANEYGIQEARNLFLDAAHILGVAIANTIMVLGVDRVVVGGGVAEVGPWFLEAIEKSIRSHVLQLYLSSMQEPFVRPAALQRNVALIGAAEYVWTYDRSL